VNNENKVRYLCYRINKRKKYHLAGYDFDFLEFVHCKFVITHIAPKFLIPGITR